MLSLKSVACPLQMRYPSPRPGQTLPPPLPPPQSRQQQQAQLPFNGFAISTADLAWPPLSLHAVVEQGQNQHVDSSQQSGQWPDFSGMMSSPSRLGSPSRHPAAGSSQSGTPLEALARLDTSRPAGAAAAFAAGEQTPALSTGPESTGSGVDTPTKRKRVPSGTGEHAGGAVASSTPKSPTKCSRC